MATITETDAPPAHPRSAPAEVVADYPDPTVPDGPTPEEIGVRRADRISLIVGAATLGYAILRYPIAKGIPWDPLFIGNKAVAFSALTLLALGVLGTMIGRRADGPVVARVCARRLGRTGLGLAVLHAAFSIYLLTPAYLPKLFAETGQLAMVGSLFAISGVVALLLLVDAQRDHAAAATRPPDDRVRPHRYARRRRIAALALGALHVGLLGAAGWLDPTGWPWWLPPITLLSAMVALTALAVRLVADIRRGRSRAA